MRKFICILFCFLMACSTAFAAETDEQHIAEFLKDFGFIESAETENIEKNATRAEFAVLAAKLIPNGYQGFSKKEQHFADVSSDREDYQSIMLLAASGAVSGTSTLNFEPDREITANEACAILVRIMGYEFRVRNGAYLTEATALGILSGTNLGDGVSFKDIYRLMYNCLFADVSTGNSIDGSPENTGSIMMMEKRFKIYEIKGIVTDDGQTSLTGESEISGECISVGGYVIKNLSGKSDLLGCNIKGYYKSDNGEDVLYSAYITERKNNIASYDADALESYENNTYGFYTDENKSKTKKEQLESDFKLIYNSKAVQSVSGISQSELNSMMAPESGSVRLIDNNGNGKYDIVSVMNYKTFVAAGYIKESKTLYDTLSRENISFDGIDTVDVTNASGTYMELENIRKDDIVSAALSIDKSYARVIISTQRVTGMLQSSEQNNEYVTISDKSYSVSKSFRNDKSFPKTGSSVTAYIRYDGIIAYIKENGGAASKFMYIQNAYILDDEPEETVGVTAFSEENEAVRLKLAEKVTIDGKRYTNANDALSYIKNHKYALDNLAIIRQNTDGFVTNMDFSYFADDSDYSSYKENENEKSLHIISGIYKMNVGMNSTFIGKGLIGLDTSTKVFVIPSGENLSDCLITTASSPILTTDSPQFSITAYITDDDSLVADAVIVRKSSSGYDINNVTHRKKLADYIVMGIETVVNPDNEVVKKFELTTGGTISYAYTVSEHGYMSDLNAPGVSDVCVGDIIRFGTDKSGNIPDNQLIVMYSPENSRDKIYFNSKELKSEYVSLDTWEIGLLYGVVDKLNDNYVKIEQINGENRIFSLGNVKYIIYDKNEKEKVWFGNYSDVISRADAGSNAPYGVFNYVEDKIRYAYIVR